MKTTGFEDLSIKIEHVVQEHIAASRKAAEAALQRAFASTAGEVARRPRSSGPGNIGRRRPPTEIAALGERLYQVVCARPGETMAGFAVDLGTSARELHRPMTHLKGTGLVRSVGQRHFTRYFPIAVTAARSA